MPKGYKCDTTVFIAYVVVYTVVYALIFIVITNMKAIVNLVISLIGRTGAADVAQETIKEEATCDTFSVGGFVQITILFYQVAGFLQVKFQGDQEKDSHFNEAVRENICNFFNFRFTLYQQVCPSDDLTLPQKEILLFGMKLATFVILLMFFIIHKVIQNLLGFCSKSTSVHRVELPLEEPGIELDIVLQPDPNEINEVPMKRFTGVSFTSMVKLTFIKLLKLYYTPVSNFALMMIHCVNILDVRKLFIYGDHVCYSGWQIAIIFIMLPSLLLFPIGLELAIRLLKKRSITSWQFMLSAMCPFFSVFLYAWKRKSRENQKDAHTAITADSGENNSFCRIILEGEEMLYKKLENRSLSWSVIQFYRTFAIATLNTFLTNPLYRLMAYNVLVAVYIIHDGIRKPYKNSYLNALPLFASASLIIVLVCNIIPAISYLVNVRTVPLIQEVVQVLGVTELIVYAAVPLSLPLWKLWNHVENFIDNKREVVKQE